MNFLFQTLNKTILTNIPQIINNYDLKIWHHIKEAPTRGHTQLKLAQNWLNALPTLTHQYIFIVNLPFYECALPLEAFSKYPLSSNSVAKNSTIYSP